MTDRINQPLIESFQHLDEVTVPVQKANCRIQMFLEMKGIRGIVRTKECIKSVQRGAFLPVGKMTGGFKPTQV